MIKNCQKCLFRIGSCRSILAGLGLMIAVAPVGIAQQNPPALQITSPADGTFVSSGQTVLVSVTSPAGVSFTQVGVVGEGYLGSDNVSASLPAQFSVVLPISLAPRRYALTAFGTTSSGQLYSSASISLDVERADLPIAITSSRMQITFQCQGQQTQLKIAGSFSDGSILDVTESSNTTYASGNPAIAAVDSNGVVTGVSAGNTPLTVTYGQGASGLAITVSISVPPPVLSPSQTSLNFGNQAVGTSSSSQTFSVTNVSNNQGLKINAVSTSGDFSETDNCVSSSPLPSGNNCTINVTFMPATTGSRAGVLNISNSQTIIAFAVPLAGTGIMSAPTITSVSPNSGALGTSVTITGTNFGSTQGTSTVTFNGTTATPTSWSTTSIVAPVPSGATTGNVLVNVGGTPSNGVNFAVNSGGNSSLMIGVNSVGSVTDNNISGQAEAFPARAITTGTLQSLTIFIDAGNNATQLTAGLYTDSGGHPGTLLTQGSSSSLTPAAWTTVNVPAANIASSITYWITILGTGGQLNFRDGHLSGCSSETSSQTTLTSLPASWTTGARWTSCRLSGYGSGTPIATLLGTVSLQTVSDHDNAGQAEAFPATAISSGTLNSLTVYIDAGNAATQLTVGLYADNGGHPGALLTQGNGSGLTSGAWTTVTVPATSVTSGTKYWIAVLGTGGQLAFRDGNQAGCSSETSSQSTLTSLPTTWTTGLTWTSCPLSGYGTQ